MPTPTYTPLANITLGSAQSSVTFSSIGQGFRDLVLVSQTLKSTAGGGTIRLQLNSDTGTNYSHVQAFAEAGTVYSYYGSTTFLPLGFWNGDSVGNTATWQLMDYSATDKHKTIIARSGNPSAIVGMATGRWANTAAVTSIYVYNDGGNFAAGSTFALYGIAA